MTSDRELLEQAAKAAGYEYGEINDIPRARIEQAFGTCGTYGCQKHQWRDWNPLEDDGDALRLAVKLGITFRHFGHKVSAVGTTQCDEYVVGDPCEATRRAIVRAAAEIGKK